MTTYNVYLLSSAGMPNDHHSLFVETNDPTTGAGHVFQVTGNIQVGMVYEDKLYPAPPEEADPTFISKKLIGTMAAGDYLENFRDVCLSVNPPKKQFDGPKRLFPQEPLRRCQEWTAEAIRALNEAGIVTESV